MPLTTILISREETWVVHEVAQKSDQFLLNTGYTSSVLTSYAATLTSNFRRMTNILLKSQFQDLTTPTLPSVTDAKFGTMEYHDKP